MKDEESASDAVKRPLLATGAEQHSSFGYNHGSRPCRDVGFAVAFLLLVFATVGIGIFAIVHHNSEFQWSESGHYDRNHSRCLKPASVSAILVPSRQVWMDSARMWLPKRLIDDEKLAIVLISSLVATLALSAPAIIGLIWLLRNFAKELVYICLPLLILVPVAFNIAWFVICTKDELCKENLSLSVRILFFVFIFLFCATIVWIIFSNFARIELTIKILTTAAEALRNNLSLLLVIPGLYILLLMLIVPWILFIIFAYMNGKLIVNPEVLKRPEITCGRGSSHECCIWQTETWVPAYITLALISLLWAASVVAQVKVFTISGTIAQWYFAEFNTHSIGALWKSFKHAFGSSFGTICFSALVFAFVRLVRSAVDSANSNEGREGLVIRCLQCCFDWILFAVQFLTKFAINFAAITGESFCSSATQTYHLLTRNLLSTVFVEVISTRLLTGIAFVISIIYASAVGGIIYGVAKLEMGEVYIVTLLSWALLLMILLVFIALMNIVVDTVYICYAIDKDKGLVSKSQAHDVYVLLPVSQHDPPSLAVT